MVIEQLTFHVPPSLYERFLREDARIWTAFLSRQCGYEGKEVWREAGQPQKLHIVIRWRSREHRNALPRDQLIETELAFTEAMGTICPILATVDYDCALTTSERSAAAVPSAGAAR